jgi:outer membrane protein
MPNRTPLAPITLLLVTLALGAGNGAVAQPPAGVPAADDQDRGVGAASLGRRQGWQTELGAAVLVNPEFQGGDDYRVLPVPYFDVRYVDEKGTRFFANVPQGVGTYFVRRRNATGQSLSIGASLAPGFTNRDPKNAPPEVNTFGTGLEGRFLVDLSGRHWGVQARASQGVVGGHGGFYVDLGASWRTRLGNRGFLAIGPNLRFGAADYMSALYSVTPEEGAATGLAPFQADAGLESVSLQGVLNLPITGKWRFTTVGRIGQLQSDAKDSSLTSNATQLFLLTAITRQF